MCSVLDLPTHRHVSTGLRAVLWIRQEPSGAFSIPVPRMFSCCVVLRSLFLASAHYTGFPQHLPFPKKKPSQMFKSVGCSSYTGIDPIAGGASFVTLTFHLTGPFTLSGFLSLTPMQMQSSAPPQLLHQTAAALLPIPLLLLMLKATLTTMTCAYHRPPHLFFGPPPPPRHISNIQASLPVFKMQTLLMHRTF
jgi:hypothetical protein